jgi:hypothetical protein
MEGPVYTANVALFGPKTDGRPRVPCLARGSLGGETLESALPHTVIKDRPARHRRLRREGWDARTNFSYDALDSLASVGILFQRERKQP